MRFTVKSKLASAFGAVIVLSMITGAIAYTKLTSLDAQEIRARGGKVIAVAAEGDEEIAKYADDVIRIPQTDELLAPVLAGIPMQLYAYHVADMLNCEIDQPRNLAKSVTVE